MLVLVILVEITLFGLSLSRLPCASRDYSNGGTVCVCNSTYCDTIPRPEIVPPPQFLIYTSNQAGLRFQQSNGTFQTSASAESFDSFRKKFNWNRFRNTIYIDSTTTYQAVIGWGGAFTDATGININSLPEPLRVTLLRSLFGEDGIEYSLGRVPIGGTDFSTRAYSYDDGPEDPELNNFNLTREDYDYKIPLILQAANLTGGNLKLVCTAWTAPRWMKTNNRYSGFGFIRRNMYQVWTNYHLKFLEAYGQYGINFWGMTTGNEPSEALNRSSKLESVGWPYWLLRIWIFQNLGPTIRNSNYSDIKIMILDDQRKFLPRYAQQVLKHHKVRQYVDGIAVHWYLDNSIPAIVLTQTQKLFPEMFILGTEASYTPNDDEKPVLLGSWSRGETYSADIIQDMQNWVTGWIDWNIALNETGGPNFLKNYVDSTIIVNATSAEFYKQPMHYHIGHFSKFVPPRSLRIAAWGRYIDGLDYVAFRRPDNGTAVIFLNRNGQSMSINVTDISRGTASLELSENSITTMLYW